MKHPPTANAGPCRQRFLTSTAVLAIGVSLFTHAQAQSVDVSKWSPAYVKSIAGTEEVDTAAECAKITPLDHKGKLTVWWNGPNDASPDIDRRETAAFWEAWKKTYPNIKTDYQNIDYNQLIDKLRTATLGNAAPGVVQLPILGGVEFSAKGYFMPLKPEDVGYPTSDFWPGAMKSVMYNGVPYGVPTNNETLGLIWNADIFKRAGLDPESPPKTWDDLVAYSKAIKDKVGVSGFGLVAKQNAGNTPFRFMPLRWAYGGGALDESSDNPEYKSVELDNAGSKKALQAVFDMYVRDKSVPVSSLTNLQKDNQAPFIAGQLGMMIAHPAEYAKMVDLASKATGSDKAMAEKVVGNMRYGLLPEGPARRAVVFGGSNIHIFKNEYVDGGLDEQAAKALACFWTSPEWSTRLAWVSSNPGNLRGFKTKWMKERLDTIKFLDVTTSMLPNGIPFPVVPEATEIVNSIIPDMIQKVLTQQMSVEDAANDAATKIKEVVSNR
jgi:multiple sugar transport system substrate-binding protein